MSTLDIPVQKKVHPSLFFSYRDRVEREIAKSISLLGEKTKLRDACEYALTNGGKRFRPLLVLLIAEALGNDLNVIEAALSVEYFHTASLIVDDLPCMDNEDERRERPALHKVFGESIALLSSYALITAAFEKIHRNGLVMKEGDISFAATADHVTSIALECAARCAGILGATGGQFLDLYPPGSGIETVREVMVKKSVTLFEVSFVFGFIFGGGDLSKIDVIRKAAYHFGLAFQTADDISDIDEDENKGKEINIVRLIGKERALLFFDEELSKSIHLLKELEIYTPSLEKMCLLLKKLAHCA